MSYEPTNPELFHNVFDDREAFYKTVVMGLERFSSFSIKASRTYFMFKLEIYFDGSERPFYLVHARESLAVDRFKDALSWLCQGKELTEVSFEEKKVCGDCAYHRLDINGDYLFCSKQGLKSTVSDKCDFQLKHMPKLGFKGKEVYTFLKTIRSMTGKFCYGSGRWEDCLQVVRDSDNQADNGQIEEVQQPADNLQEMPL